MAEEKETIILRISSEFKEAIKIAADAEHRKMTNFIEFVLLSHPKVKEALKQGSEASQEKISKEVIEPEKTSVGIKGQKDLTKMRHSF